MDQVKRLKQNPDNIFESIKQLNGWETIFPDDEQIKDIKLNEALINRIFDEFLLVDCTKKTAIITLMKNVYNIYFKRFIINGKKDKSKHMTYKIKQDDRDMLEFGMGFLKIENSDKCIDPFIDDTPNQIDRGITIEEPKPMVISEPVEWFETTYSVYLDVPNSFEIIQQRIKQIEDNNENAEVVLVTNSKTNESVRVYPTKPKTTKLINEEVVKIEPIVKIVEVEKMKKPKIDQSKFIIDFEW